MTRIFRAELVKSISTRTVLAFLLGGVAFALLNAVIVAAASGTLRRVTEKEEALSSLPILMLVWGLVGAAGEYRHRTAAPAALVAGRGRGVVLLGRLSAYGVSGLAIGVVTTAASLALGLPLLSSQPGPALTVGQISAVVAGNLIAGVLSAIMGAAVGALIRNQIVGVVVLLIFNFAVVPLVSGAQEELANLTPFGALSVLSRMTHDTTLSTSAAAGVLLIWTAVLVLAAVAGERRRDLA